MDDKDIEAFKNELKNLKYHKNRSRLIQDQIDEVEYYLNGVRGIGFEERSHGTNPDEKIDQRFKLETRRDKLLAEKEHHDRSITYCETILMMCPSDARGMMVDVYVNKKTLLATGDKYHRSAHGVLTRISSALKKIGRD